MAAKRPISLEKETKNWMVRIGNLVEESISKGIYELGAEAPILAGTPEEKVWYQVPVPEGKCGDGSEYHIYVRKGTSKKLCVFFSGGGIAINEYMAARPVNGGSVAAWLPNYYWNNLRLFTQVMNINVGITKNGADNPFDDWNFLVITYATGDMHVGDCSFPYHVINEKGNKTRKKAILHFHGYKNFMASMRIGKKLFPEAEKLLIAGESAGAFAVPALAEQVVGEFYPACQDVTLFSDSAQLLYRGWKRTLRDVWQTRREIWSGVNGANLTLEWYRGVVARQGNRFKYLYAGSIRDYLLSFRQMQRMIVELQRLTPDFSFFIYDWHRPLSMYKGGTIHTAVRQPEFTLRTQDDVTMAYWLHECVEGKAFDVGMQLLHG